MKINKVILMLFFSSILSGCVSKESMNTLTNNYLIAIYSLGTIVSFFNYFRYSSSDAFKIGIISFISVVYSILYRCGYIDYFNN